MIEPPTKARLRASSSGRATLNDIADRIGVSSITVSRAFRKPEKVADELRERIQKVADELGYVSNRAASALASARSMNIAVIIPALTNSVFVDVLGGIDEVLRPKGYHMLLGISNYSSVKEEDLVRTYLAFDPDGFLLTGVNYRESTRRLLEKVNIPVVHMMELSDQPGACCVGFSHAAAASAMTDYLIEKGRRRIGFVATQLDSRILARNRGCRDALIRAGLYDPQLELLVPDPSSVALGGILLSRMLEQTPDVDAVFFGNDDLAQGGLFECLRRGIKVPEQLSIAGFNDLPISASMVPSLTTVATPRFEIGAQAAKMLVGLLEGQAPAKRNLDLGYVLKPRDSA